MDILTRILRKVIKPEVIIKEINNSPIDSIELLKGKVALITGGSRGIGECIAHKLYNAGAKVILVGKTKKNLELACSKFASRENINYIDWDITDLKVVRGKVNDAFELWEKQGVDILINCAGTTGMQQDFLEITEENYDKIMDTNLKAMYFITQEVVNSMLKRNQKGYIINISSMVGVKPATNIYQISKWGVTGFTKGIARILAPKGIIVNGIAPGVVTTDMMKFKDGDLLFRSDTPDERWALPDEIANIVLFLVSGYANHIVGEVISCDGGFLLN